MKRNERQAKGKPHVPQADLETGLVVSTHGRHCVVETPDRRRLICHPRGKKSEVVVGDRVTWHLTQEQADGLVLNARIAAGWIEAPPEPEAVEEEAGEGDELSNVFRK